MTRKKRDKHRLNFQVLLTLKEETNEGKYLIPANGPRTKHWVALSEMEFWNESHRFYCGAGSLRQVLVNYVPREQERLNPQEISKTHNHLVIWPVSLSIRTTFHWEINRFIIHIKQKSINDETFQEKNTKFYSLILQMFKYLLRK